MIDMWFKRKRDVVVVDDGYYRNLKEEIDILKKEVKELKKANEKINDYVGEQTHVNQVLSESFKRMKRDVDSLKRGTD